MNKMFNLKFWFRYPFQYLRWTKIRYYILDGRMNPFCSMKYHFKIVGFCKIFVEFLKLNFVLTINYILFWNAAVNNYFENNENFNRCLLPILYIEGTAKKSKFMWLKILLKFHDLNIQTCIAPLILKICNN